MSPLNNLHGRVLVVNGRGAAPAVVARESVGADSAGGLDAQAGGCRTRVGQGRPPRPPSGPRRRELSKSVAKARIESRCRRRIVGIPGFFSRSIPARGAFVADLDNCPPRIAPGAPCAPPRGRPRDSEPG